MQLPHGKTLKKIWMAVVVLYAAARAITVDILLGDYGVRGEVYFAIEIFTSIPFARFSSYLVEDLALERRWARNALITGAFYLAPDIYLLATIHEAPSHVFLLVVIAVLLLSALSIYIFRRRALIKSE